MIYETVVVKLLNIRFCTFPFSSYEVVLQLEEKSPVIVGWGAAWAPKPLWKPWKREKSLFLPFMELRFLGRSTSSLVTKLSNRGWKANRCTVVSSLGLRMNHM